MSPPPSFFLFQDSQATQAQQLHYLKINQSINQSNTQPTNQTHNQPTNQSIDMLKQQIKHTKQSCNPLTERSIIKTINQPINLLREQSIKHLLNRPNDQTNKSNLIRSNTILIIHKQSLQTPSKIKQPT